MMTKKVRCRNQDRPREREKRWEKGGRKKEREGI
jgi:hypothetical protein